MEELIVIKCGGSTVESLSDDFFKGIKALQQQGKKPVIVHGGGPRIKKMLTALHIQSEMVNGLRKTTPEVMTVVEMVLSGNVNKELVRKLQKHGVYAFGVTGCDGLLLQAKAKDLPALGLVGEIVKVNDTFLHNMIDLGAVPVISPIAAGMDGEDCYNINADTAASAIANALEAKQILFVTDVPGILKDNQLLSEVTPKELVNFIHDGTITGGMIPKVHAAMESLQGEAEEIMIVSGHANIVGDGHIIGTKIRNTVGVIQ
ncbi:acetylglutamate kinase [Bacillus chungangensis]